MERSIIIIGAGIAGLSAGCYGQMNGYRTQIFESHDKPGGLCTSWKRQGYTFDGCVHWWVGSAPGNNFYRVWEELGAIQGRDVVNHDEFLRVQGPGDKTMIVYTNADRLEEHLKELAPADSRQIEQLCNTIRTFSRADVPIEEPKGLFGKVGMILKMMPFMRTMKKYSAMTVQEFADGFSDPFLREAFPRAFGYDVPEFPVAWMLMNLGWMHAASAGYPVGGSLPLSRAIEHRYLELGGEMHYKSPVVKILVEGDRAVGVRLADGTEHRSDLVVSAADGRTTIFDMLEGKYVDDTIRGYYDDWALYGPVIQVSLGVNRDLSNEPHMVAHRLKEPVTIGGAKHDSLSVRHYCYDPTMAPSGKSTVVVLAPGDYEYWKELQQDPGRYAGEKEQVADTVIAAVEQLYPGISQQIEAVDVATPTTTERYTGNWKGSIMGWADTTSNMGMMMSGGMSRTLPGLAGLYMIGQWVYPGNGLPGAALSARNGIRLICDEDEKQFTAQVP